MNSRFNNPDQLKSNISRNNNKKIRYDYECSNKYKLPPYYVCPSVSPISVDESYAGAEGEYGGDQEGDDTKKIKVINCAFAALISIGLLAYILAAVILWGRA